VINVDFEHWQYTFPDDLLVKYGSPFFSQNDAGWAYTHHIHDHATRRTPQFLTFTEHQIVAGNEAFPENAVADPIADLEVWDEWKQGTRYFPYPGRYSKLGITHQEQKTSCPASVGVLGEIMAGFFGQAGVSPWILVRVVRHWPDFIFSHSDRTYSFVESKAFATNASGDTGLRARTLDAHLVEGAFHAAQQLNCDSFGRVWYCITQIRGVTPLDLVVTLLELRVSDARKVAQTIRTMPAVVAEGLAERAVNQAAAKIGLVDADEAVVRLKSEGQRLKSSLESQARAEVEGLLSEASEEPSSIHDVQPISEAINRIVTSLASRKRASRFSEDKVGTRFRAAKESAAECRLSRLRGSGDSTLFLADLPRNSIRQTRHNWVPDWAAASNPWGQVRGTPLWRCGGAVICTGSEELEGTDLGNEVRFS
jgi:hypothetical protein